MKILADQKKEHINTSANQPHYDILPVSVIECQKSDKKRRHGEKNFDKKSSRTMYSEFWPEACKLSYQHWLRDCTSVVDPFSGWGERHFFAKHYGINYTGFDLNPEAISYSKEEYGIDNILADSMVVDIPKFDGMLTCPPYWNLEKYSKNLKGGDQIKKWTDFCAWYEKLFRRFYDAADPEAYFVIVTGNFRKNNVYYDLDFLTRHIFMGFGALMMDSVVLSRRKISKIKIMLPQAKRLKYSVNVHETMNVFKKPL